MSEALPPARASASPCGGRSPSRAILNPQVAGPGALGVDALLGGLGRDVLGHVRFTSA